MSGSLNKVQLIGNLGRDPEIRNFPSGGRVANLRIATSERWRDKSGNQQERTEWHSVSVFNDGLITIIERYLQKGAKIFIEGSLQTRKWTDNQQQDRYSTEVIVRSFGHQLIMLGSGRAGSEGGDFIDSPSADRMAADRMDSARMDTDRGNFSNPSATVDPLPDDDIPF